jgi:PAS domain S-box-containing protein
MHQHLERQLRRLALDTEAPPGKESWQELLAWISTTYGNMDRERQVVAHLFAVTSQETRELAERSAEERDKFASIFKAAPLGMVVMRIDGIIIDVNEALIEMLGYTRDEFMGCGPGEFLDRSELDSVKGLLLEFSQGRMSSFRSDRRFVTKKGEPIVVDVQSRVVSDADGRPKLILSILDDVTDRYRLEVELRHSQKLESVGRLAAGIAHEINTPIQFVGDNVTFLSGAFEQLLSLCETYRDLCEKAAAARLSAQDIALQKRCEDAADLSYIRENVPASIASTLDGVARVAKIVQSMKAFAHPDRGERSVADINAALRNTITVATNEFKYVANVETDFGDIPAVSCFLSDLNQVFLNLLVNAAHAIGDVVGKSGQRGTIHVRTFQEGEQVVVAIRDTGTGIPIEVRGKIFDPFFTTKGVGKGTGQGLALARSVVVEQHSGTITFDTEMGKGTTFYVRIPIAAPSPGESGGT